VAYSRVVRIVVNRRGERRVTMVGQDRGETGCQLVKGESVVVLGMGCLLAYGREY
jgi:hypothetical protein